MLIYYVTIIAVFFTSMFAQDSIKYEKIDQLLLAFMLVLLLEGLLMNTIGIWLQILEILNLKSIILKVMESGN